METNQIKKFAQEARKVLLEGIDNKLGLLGFDKQGYIAEEKMPVKGTDHIVFMGKVITDMTFYDKWMSLRERIIEKGIKEVKEEAAYTWFNRFVAIRIIVKNGFTEPVLEYQSTSLRLPRIVADARRGIYAPMSESDRAYLMELLDNDALITEQFTLLIINYCHRNPILSACFGSMDDYTELLLPVNILAEGGFVDMLNHTEFITEDDYRQSELIGWLYQFYISEKKDEVFASFKNKKKAEADDIPAATQIFTPNWIVKYMVQNTVGRIYLDNNPYAMDIKEQMKYLVEPAEPTPAEAVFHYEDIHSLSVADLGCGSGHILNEAFDLLYSIYIEEGYNRRKAIEDIFHFNLLGVDLDTRAKQLAMFALLIKACQKDNSFLDAHCLPRVLDMSVASKVRRLNAKGNVAELLTEFFAGANKKLITETLDALALMEQADNLGSIMKFELSDTTRTAIAMRSSEWKEIGTDNNKIKTLLSAFDIILALTDKYTALVMNPPYMGSGNMNAELSEYVKKNYAIGKSDLATVFVELMPEHLVKNGKYGFIIPPSWMFLSTFEDLRKNIIENNAIDSLLHLSRGVFGADFGASSAVISNTKNPEADGTYFRLIERTFQEFDQKHLQLLFEKTLDNHEFRYYFADYNKEVEDIVYSENGAKIYYPDIQQKNFKKIPGNTIGYWVSTNLINMFSIANTINDFFDVKSGLSTGNNDIFVRFWHEVNLKKECFLYSNEIEDRKMYKWLPYSKGGGVQKWYGNNFLVVNWENEAQAMRESGLAVFRNESYYFNEGITWSGMSSTYVSYRMIPNGFIFDSNKGPMIFPKMHNPSLLYTIGFLNTKVSNLITSILNPTVSTQIGDIIKVPLAIKDSVVHKIEDMANNNISISQQDWDSHETSWDFEENPLLSYINQGIAKGEIGKSYKIESLYNLYTTDWEERFIQLHANEEELNRQFIEIYGLQDELTPDVPLDEVTILQQGEIKVGDNHIEFQPDVVVKQFISYAVGCMMGRYRLDKPGLYIAHPNPTDDEVCTYSYNGRNFTIDDDAIIPLMARDTVFTDNAGERFREFLKVALGEDTLTENLNFIEAALGKDIDTYFVKDFWKDQLSRYQRRPIYWLFASKKGAFQCITYMHRMNPYTVEQIRNKYLLPHIEYLGTRIAEMESRAATLSTKERKDMAKLQKDLEECREYHDRLHLVADKQIDFDLDDGVVVNYAKFGDVVVKLK
ncbi:BREX-1 system adenine-specific DNA-methyltransferase PglX [Bacteroides caecigallinarum]|uniref:BREX-1 system adenine-specific DNA-methyltransferase PglX n=1 Tax=Bacteroides caecigallinarum TaxID=1411144 RepID=UPI00195797BD|nr:BREX-1 system adenine-specific DNA-methyltransferase PglX [Bacteroides caecigallinarum]MBM6960865.1 BREX-1 system adenine-specific DNA-methyltransferase PglX [Bacteroides caecigallinarum]